MIDIYERSIQENNVIPRIGNEGELKGAEKRCGGTPALEIPAYVSPIAVIYNLEGVDELRLELTAQGLVGEDQGPHPWPVEVALGRQHLRPEGLHDGRQAGRAPRDDLAGELVGVDDDRPELTQDRGHGALAGGDAPGQSDAHGGTLLWGRGRPVADRG